MLRNRKLLWTVAIAIGLVGGALACANEVGPVGQGSEEENISGPELVIGSRLSTACHAPANPRLYLQDVKAKCVEIWGNTLSLSLAGPNQGAQSVYSCVGLGQAPLNAPLGAGEWDVVATPNTGQHTFAVTGDYHLGKAVTSSQNFEIGITPLRPVANPIPFTCKIDEAYGGVRTVNVTVTSPVAPMVTLITGTLPNPRPAYFRPGQSETVQPEGWRDNFGFDNEADLANTFTYSSDNPSIVSINSTTGVTAVLARGTTSVRANAGTATRPRDYYVKDCTAISVNPNTAITLAKGASTTRNVTMTCDSPINTSTEPVYWESANPAVATVTGSGTGNHVGTITGTGGATTQIRACVNAPITRLCSSWVSVTSQAIVTNVTSPSAGGTILAGLGTSGSLPFTVTNIGNISGSTTIACVATGTVSCGSLSVTNATLAPAQSVNGTLGYSVGGATGFGTLTLTANPGGGSVVFNFSAIVTSEVTHPQAGAWPYPGVTVNTTGSTSYAVKNIWGETQTFNLSCSGWGGMSCTGTTPTSVTLAPNATANVTVNYSVGSTNGTGGLTLSATGGGTATVYYDIQGAPLTVQIISGPSSVRPGAQCEWMASASGGYSPYTWQWTVDGDPETGTGNDIYYTNHKTHGQSFQIGITVTDANSDQVTAYQTVNVSSSAPICQL